MIDDREGARSMERFRQTLDAEDDMDKDGVDACEIRLEMSMQLVGRISTALFAPGNKVFAENGAIAVDDNKSER